MKYLLLAALVALLGACAAPMFVADAPLVPVTGRTPQHFDLPARFALVRTVYGRSATAGTEEAALWINLATRFQSMGTFSPLEADEGYRRSTKQITDKARAQRYRYVILVSMDPKTGSAHISLLDAGSGGLMATAQAVAPEGGRSGFWGHGINNPRRLARVTNRIARVAVPKVEEMLRGAIQRQK